MSQLTGSMFDQVIRGFYSLSDGSHTSRDEERSFYYAQELRIEVSGRI